MTLGSTVQVVTDVTPLPLEAFFFKDLNEKIFFFLNPIFFLPFGLFLKAEEIIFDENRFFLSKNVRDEVYMVGFLHRIKSYKLVNLSSDYKGVAYCKPRKNFKLARVPALFTSIFIVVQAFFCHVVGGLWPGVQLF